MMVKDALHWAAEVLHCHGIEDARLEAEVLLMHTVNVQRAKLYADGDRHLDRMQVDFFRQMVERRLCHEPTAYITNHKEFFGIEFYVDSRALIPRPETELLVEKVIEYAGSYGQGCLIADVGTGCGAIAVSMALHVPHAEIYAIDISTAVLKVALINCKKHNVEDRITLLHGDMLQPLPQKIDVIVSNLPYVKDGDFDNLSTEIRSFEPRLALAGGVNGTDWITKLLREAVARLRSQGLILMEIGEGQGKTVSEIARSCFPWAEVTVFPDWAGLDRIVGVQTRGS